MQADLVLAFWSPFKQTKISMKGIDYIQKYIILDKMVTHGNNILQNEVLAKKVLSLRWTKDSNLGVNCFIFSLIIAFRGTSKSSFCFHKCALSSYRSWFVYLAPTTVEYPSNTIPWWGALCTTFGPFAHPTPFDQIAILLVYVSITHGAISSRCAFYKAYYGQDQQQKVGCTRHSRLKERNIVTYKLMNSIFGK